ncbi:hypothetical protein GCM10009530_63980 [Microbispora corallina]|uniref:Uncharacterized protein n=1 Tax=Microbispora corallina TaxID=83302 RepID=A0ABQ4GCB8_9ACTN|nr:hypothetical protein [Microbispora corallina]GIH44719.1 hypothetical protein Mco01_77190 [Microbispora corallina]
MDIAQLPIVQGGALAVLLAVLWLVFRGQLKPRKDLDDLRADHAKMIEYLRADRDARLADAERDAERGWAAYELERAAHERTRQALVDQVRAATAPALAAAETTEKILSELQQRPGARA